MEKRDIIACLIAGELIALLSFGILKNFGIEQKLVYWLLPILMPIFCLFCLYIAFILKKTIPMIWQLAKFILIGVLNTIIDLGILNFLMYEFNVFSGLLYSSFKGISFLGATTNSYFWNKFWTFNSKKKVHKKEFTQFFFISGIGFLINIGTATIIVNAIGPQFGLSSKVWANFGAIIASFAGMTWNFLGYKFWVFKKQ